MEFSIVVYPYFFYPSKKAILCLRTVLDTPASYTPREWLQLVRDNDPDRDYIVTSLWHYKQSRPLPSCQHEYIVLEVRQRSRTFPSPATPPALIKVSRTLMNDTLLARLGLWGPATNTVEIQPPGMRFIGRCLHRLTWLPDRAPALYRIAQFILAVHDAMPQYFVTRTSCYAFARAIKDSIYIRFNGLEGPQPCKFLTRESHFLCIPTGTTKAQCVAAGIAAIAKVVGLSQFKISIAAKLIGTITDGEEQGRVE